MSSANAIVADLRKKVFRAWKYFLRALDEFDLPLEVEMKLFCPRLQRKKILIAEDESAICESLKIFLGDMEGADVTIVSNGAEAVAAVAREEFDIMLLDLTLPGLDGESVMRQVRAAGSSIPLVALSGRLLKEAPQAGGFDAFLAKPFDFEELVTLILRVLDQRASRLAKAASE
jgi:DNA-binding response OmpR family regulator